MYNIYIIYIYHLQFPPHEPLPNPNPPRCPNNRNVDCAAILRALLRAEA